MENTVVIDAGHGGYDNGARYKGRREKDDTLRLALAVENILTKNCVNVVLTRSEDVYNTPYEKAMISNNVGADLFVSIHRNAYEPNVSKGVETLVLHRHIIASIVCAGILIFSVPPTITQMDLLSQ